jgi:hypothetical protein
MADWWEAAPLASAAPAQPTPAAGANWWEAAPLAQEAAQAPAPVQRAEVPQGVTRITVTPQGSDRGTVDAAARGAAQGLTANFSDEIRGLVEAGGANPDDPASVYKLISGALQYFGGDQEAKQRYDAAVARERELNQQAETQHPVASTAGQVGGALALPIGAMGQAATLPGRVAAGVGVGAAFGGASGAGAATDANSRITQGITGAGVGGALGAAGPVLLKGVELAGSGVSKALEPIVNSIRGYREPEGEAARRVVSSISRDYRNGTPGLSGGEFRAAQAEGTPVKVMDLGGETTRALARSAANTSPEGRAVLGRAIDDRYEGQTGRLTDWLRSSFNYPDAMAQQAALENVAKTINRPAYAKAYAQGRAGIWDDELSAMSEAPAVRSAVQAATRTIQNKSATSTNDPALISRWVNGGKPTLEFWDQVKRELDQGINVAKREGRREDFATLTDIKNTLISKLDAAVPDYARARSGASQFFGAQDALEAGQKFVTENFANKEARAAIAKMSPIERHLFQDGFVSRFIETLERTGDRRNVLNQIAQSPAAREKINIALGPQKAAELEAKLRVEGIMDLARGAVQGNSTTARQLIEAGLAGGTGYGIVTGDWNPKNVFTAAFVGGVARGAAAKANTKIDQRVAKSVADMLVSDNPRILQRGVSIVAKQPVFLNALRKADAAIARVSGGQSGGVPLLQGPVASRADDKQQ